MRLILSLFCAAVFSHFTAAAACCVPVVYIIDQSRSQITLSGTSAGQPFMEQQAGSLQTRFTGNIRADLTQSQITFTSATIVAQNSGSYIPEPGNFTGSAPANYGFAVFVPGLGMSALGALRNLQVTMTSPALPITNGQFPNQQITLRFTGGSLDLTLGFPGTSFNTPVNQDPFTNTASPGSLSQVGIRETLTIPIMASQIDAPIGGDVTEFVYVGEIVATRRNLKKFMYEIAFESLHLLE